MRRRPNNWSRMSADQAEFRCRTGGSRQARHSRHSDHDPVFRRPRDRAHVGRHGGQPDRALGARSSAQRGGLVLSQALRWVCRRTRLWRPGDGWLNWRSVMTDPYETLGVKRTATEAEIKAAFKNLARQHHPDLHPDDKRPRPSSRTSRPPTTCSRIAKSAAVSMPARSMRPVQERPQQRLLSRLRRRSGQCLACDAGRICQ